MHTIRISKRAIAECEEYLRANGIYREGMKLNKMVETLISHVVYGTVDIEEGRKKAADILAKASGADQKYRLRGKLAQFARTADWSGKSGKGSSVPSKVLALIRETERDLEGAIEVQENVINANSSEVEIAAVRSPNAPWIDLPKENLDNMARKYPKHTIWKWIRDDQMREIAASVAFALVPKQLHRTDKVDKLAVKLCHEFLSWEKGGDTNTQLEEGKQLTNKQK